MAKNLISSRSWIDILFAYVLLALCVMMIKYLDRSTLLAVVTVVGGLCISKTEYKPVNKWPALFQFVYRRIQSLREKTRIGRDDSKLSELAEADGREALQTDGKEAPETTVGDSPTVDESDVLQAFDVPVQQPSMFDDDTSVAAGSKKRSRKPQCSTSVVVPNKQQLALCLPRLITEIDIEADSKLYTPEQLEIIRYTKALKGEPPLFTLAFFDLPDCVRRYICDQIKDMHLDETGLPNAQTRDQLLALERVVAVRKLDYDCDDADGYIAEAVVFGVDVARKIRRASYGPLKKKFAALKSSEWKI